MPQPNGMAFSTPSAAQSSASSKVQLWRPAQEVLQFLTECVLPNPALSYPESGSACVLSDLDHKMSITAAGAVKRPPPPRWEPPAQMKINHPSAPSEEVGDGNLSSEMESSGQIVSSSKVMESQEMGSTLIDCAPTLEASSAVGSSVAGESTFVGSLGSPKSELGVCESAPGASIQEHGSSASMASDGLLQNSNNVEKGEGNIEGSEKDHPEPLDLLMNAIRVASKSSKPGDGEKQGEGEKIEHHHPSLGVHKRVAIFVHGHVPFAQKRVSRRAKSSYLNTRSAQKEEEKLIASNAVCDTSFHKEESPEDGWLFEKHGKQASLESIIYGDAGLPIRSKRGRSQTLPSRYPDTTVSTTYKRSRSKSFKCSSKIWTFA